MVGFAMVLGGAMEGYGAAKLEAAKAQREAALQELRDQREMKFRRDEAAIGRNFEAGENDKQRKFQSENAQGDMVDLDGGKYGVRKGATVEPLVDNTGSQVTIKPKAGFRQLSPDEIKARGLDPNKAYQVSETGDNAGKVDEIGGGGVNIDMGGGKLTEAQSKDVGFFSRGLYANDDLSSMDEELTSLSGNVAGRFGVPGNYYKEPKYRQAERAGKDFLAVILRKDTGAAITAQEFQDYGQIFLPWPGDDQQTLVDKRAARERAIEGIELGLGTARPIAKGIREEFAAKPPRPGRKATPEAISAPTGVDPGLWEVMTPEERALWK